jgi:hypothetical protein
MLELVPVRSCLCQRVVVEQGGKRSLEQVACSLTSTYRGRRVWWEAWKHAGQFGQKLSSCQSLEILPRRLCPMLSPHFGRRMSALIVPVSASPNPSSPKHVYVKVLHQRIGCRCVGSRPRPVEFFFNERYKRYFSCHSNLPTRGEATQHLLSGHRGSKPAGPHHVLWQ